MQLTRQEILDKLKDILITVDPARREQVEKADEEVSLLNDFGFSSVNVLFLVIAIEESFGIRFDNVTMNDFNKIGDVINYIEGKLK